MRKAASTICLAETVYRRRRPIEKRGHFCSVVVLLAGTPCSAGRSVGAGNDYHVAVRVPYPELPVIRTAVAIGRVSMAGHDDLDAHFSGALHDRVKVVHLEPQQYTVSVWFIIAIANST